MKSFKLRYVFAFVTLGILSSPLLASQSKQPESSLKLYFRPTQGAGNSMSLAGMPFVLKADGVKIKQGVLDDGFILVPHRVLTEQYEFEMANGGKFVVPVEQLSICQKNHFSRVCLVQNGILPNLEISKIEKKQELANELLRYRQLYNDEASEVEENEASEVENYEASEVEDNEAND